MRYRLEWEAVSIYQLWRYMDADPAHYAGTTQTVPNSQVPDEHWHIVSREDGDGDSIRSQHATLKGWADNDEQFVRNVRLYELAGAPQWREVETVPPL